MCDLLLHMLTSLLLLAGTWISCFSTFAFLVGILQNSWHHTGFSAQLDDKTRWSNVDIPLSTFIFQNFTDAEIQKCLLFIKHNTHAIELLEELLSSKLNLKMISCENIDLWFAETFSNICWTIFLSGKIQSVREEREDWFQDNHWDSNFELWLPIHWGPMYILAASYIITNPSPAFGLCLLHLFN